MKYTVLLLALLISTGLFSQEGECGYKEECFCNTLNETVEYSYGISAIVIEGTVIKIDTVSISQVIFPDSVHKIVNDTLDNSLCAKKVLETEKVVIVKIKVNETFKGEVLKEDRFILTPLNKKSCGYSGFQINNKYVVYGTFNSTADVYFLWTIDKDFFYLKPEYRYWTNKCKRTRVSNTIEINELKKITEPKK